jgi:hypothetical protein
LTKESYQLPFTQTSLSYLEPAEIAKNKNLPVQLILAKLSCPALFLKIVRSSFSTSFVSPFFYLKITLCKGALQTTSRKSSNLQESYLLFIYLAP